MRWIIVGPGAVGGLLAARLIGAGETVHLVGRGARAEAIARAGLTLRSPTGTRVFRPAGVHSGIAVDGADIVVLAVKSQDTRAAIAALRGELGTVVCAQNGVTNEDEAARAFATVIGAMVWTPVLHLDPGVVCSYAMRDAMLRVGGEGAEAIAATFARAGFDAQVVADVMRWKRGKLLTNLGNALDALVVPPVPDELHARVVVEGEAVLRASGLGYLAPKTLIADAVARVPDVPLDGVRRPGGSTWQSVARGAGAGEIAYFNGYIAELGARVSVTAPLNRKLAEIALRPGLQPRSIAARTVSSVSDARG
jgi:2-dehydropantoate 2-reductase